MEMFRIGGTHLPLDRCPYCGIAKPHLQIKQSNIQTAGTGGERWWAIYACSVCGGIVLAGTELGNQGLVTEFYPSLRGPFHESIPPRAREFLHQARDTVANATASLMVCASAVDAMLKDKGLREGSLYARIGQAVERNFITPDMAKWAHQVRLDANDQRHADEGAMLPTQKDAERSFGFAVALADVLYVIPPRVTRGIEESKPVEPTTKPK